MGITEIRYREVQEHAARLSWLLKELHVECSEFLHLSEWLDMASAITTVEVVWSRFDSCELCPRDYDDARGEMLEVVVKNLTTFNFIWGGLEALIDIINPKFEKRGGKITGICKFLKHHFEPSPAPVGYYELITELCDLRRKDRDAKSIKQYKLSDFLGISGIGLKAVYELRNSFAHGVYTIPEPAEWSRNAVDHSRIILISSQITLITIQMIMTAYFKDQEILVDYKNSDNELIEEMPLHHILRQIHLSSFFEDKSNLFLE